MTKSVHHPYNPTHHPPCQPAATINLPKASFSSQNLPTFELEEHCVSYNVSVCLISGLFFKVYRGRAKVHHSYVNLLKVMGNSPPVVDVVYQVLREHFFLIADVNEKRPGTICRVGKYPLFYFFEGLLI